MFLNDFWFIMSFRKLVVHKVGKSIEKHYNYDLELRCPTPCLLQIWKLLLRDYCAVAHHLGCHCQCQNSDFSEAPDLCVGLASSN
jgi:hypothetical protein